MMEALMEEHDTARSRIRVSSQSSGRKNMGSIDDASLRDANDKMNERSN